MSTASPILIDSPNLTHAWGKAFLHVIGSAQRDIAPLIVSVGGFDSELPPEDEHICEALNSALAKNKKNPSDVSGMVIFPYRFWMRRGRPNCAQFSNFCTNRLYPRLRRRDQRNKYGIYFQRMMDFTGIKKGAPATINQLQFIIDLLKCRHPRPRHSALQIACFDPVKDHTRQRVRGFPCLQQISFSYDDDNGLALTAYYPSQYIFDRAYGNYLGLCHLGNFVAHETGYVFRRMTCIAYYPSLGAITGGKLRILESVVRDRLQQQQ